MAWVPVWIKTVRNKDSKHSNRNPEVELIMNMKVFMQRNMGERFWISIASKTGGMSQCYLDGKRVEESNSSAVIKECDTHLLRGEIVQFPVGVMKFS